MKCIITFLIVLITVSSVGAVANDCEWLAKYYQDGYGGYLIFIQPLKDNGAYDLGAFNGHWLNKAYNKERGIYYYDSQTDNYFKSESEILDWYELATNKKAVLFNVNQGGVPFAIRYHY